MYLFFEVSFFIVNSGVRKGRATDMVHAELRVPLAVKVIYFETPLFFMFENIDYLLKVATVGAMRGEVFNYFE
jgi:hypothetical protein